MFEELGNLMFNDEGQTSSLESEKDIVGIIEDWDNIRKIMLKKPPPEFTRDELAYLVNFISKRELMEIYISTFGELTNIPRNMHRKIRPIGNVSLWSPNNVSLLAPLTMILVSISGNKLRIKLGSRGTDLCSPLINWIKENSKSGPLVEWLEGELSVKSFDRESELNRKWSEWADVRIVFGSDMGCKSISDLPCSEETRTYLFSNKVSQIWCTNDDMDSSQIETLIKVFSIYGTAGCTSPRIVKIIDGSIEDCENLARRISISWDSVISGEIEMHSASQNLLSHQIAKSKGWESWILGKNSAVIAVGGPELNPPEGNRILPITHSSLDDSFTVLPPEIQTIGYSLPNNLLDKIEENMINYNIKRLVPIGEMHHFGPIWDGMHYWRGMFIEVES